MQDEGEPTPSERDEAIYAAWRGGKSLHVLAREFGISVMAIDLAIDRCLPVFSTQTQMRAYKREIQQLEDVGTYYHASAMDGDIDSAHVYARINERRCAMSGWSSVNIRLDPYSAQVKEEPSDFEQIRAAILRVARPERFQQLNGNGAALAPPLDPSTDDQNRFDSEQSSTPTNDAP